MFARCAIVAFAASTALYRSRICCFCSISVGSMTCNMMLNLLTPCETIYTTWKSLKITLLVIWNVAKFMSAVDHVSNVIFLHYFGLRRWSSVFSAAIVTGWFSVRKWSSILLWWSTWVHPWWMRQLWLGCCANLKLKLVQFILLSNIIKLIERIFEVIFEEDESSHFR